MHTCSDKQTASQGLNPSPLSIRYRGHRLRFLSEGLSLLDGPCPVYCILLCCFQHLAVVHGMLLSARLPVKPVPWYLFAVSTGFTNEIRARVIKIVEIIGILQRCKCEHQMQDTLETTLVYNFRATPPCSCQL